MVAEGASLSLFFYEMGRLTTAKALFLSSSLTVFQDFGLHIGVGIGIAVAGCLILLFCQQQITHLGATHTIVVLIQSQILLCLYNSIVGNEQLLVAGLHSSPGTVHVDDEFLTVVCQLLTGIVESQLLLLDGM